MKRPFLSFRKKKKGKVISNRTRPAFEQQSCHFLNWSIKALKQGRLKKKKIGGTGNFFQWWQILCSWPCANNVKNCKNSQRSPPFQPDWTWKAPSCCAPLPRRQTPTELTWPTPGCTPFLLQTRCSQCVLHRSPVTCQEHSKDRGLCTSVSALGAPLGLLRPDNNQVYKSSKSLITVSQFNKAKIRANQMDVRENGIYPNAKDQFSTFSRDLLTPDSVWMYTCSLTSSLHPPSHPNPGSALRIATGSGQTPIPVLSAPLRAPLKSWEQRLSDIPPWLTRSRTYWQHTQHTSAGWLILEVGKPKWQCKLFFFKLNHFSTQKMYFKRTLHLLL